MYAIDRGQSFLAEKITNSLVGCKGCFFDQGLGEIVGGYKDLNGLMRVIKSKALLFALHAHGAFRVTKSLLFASPKFEVPQGFFERGKLACLFRVFAI